VDRGDDQVEPGQNLVVEIERTVGLDL